MINSAKLNDQDDPYIHNFQIDINMQMVSVTGRILNAPTVIAANEVRSWVEMQLIVLYL